MMNVDVRIPCHTDRRSFVKFRSLRAAHNLHSTVVHNSPSLHIWSHLVVPARWNLSSFSTLFSTSLYFLAWCSRRPCSLPSTTNQRLPPKSHHHTGRCWIGTPHILSLTGTSISTQSLQGSTSEALNFSNQTLILYNFKLKIYKELN